MYVDALFIKEEFTRSHANHCLYIKQSKYLVIVIDDVDDLIIMTNTMSKSEK